MQLKIYKRSTALLILTIILDIASITFLITNREQWQDNALPVILGFVLFIFVLALIYAYYDLNADRNLIKKRVSNGDVALAKINNGSFVRFGRDARLRNHVYWKLDAELFDNDMQKFDVTIIEKFSTHQTSIPKGYVYVTYVEGQENDCLIIPNIIIASIPEYKVLVDEYEKKLKPKYLNAYIKDGLLLQTYEDSLRLQKQYEKLGEEIDSEDKKTDAS